LSAAPERSLFHLVAAKFDSKFDSGCQGESGTFRISLTSAAEILPAYRLRRRPLRLALWAQVQRIVFRSGVKALLDGKIGDEATAPATGSEP